MKCQTGSFNCQLIAQSMRNGKPFRFLCRACRLKRCMKLVNDSFSSGSLTKSDVAIEQHGELENNLALIMSAKDIVSNNMRMCQLRKNERSMTAEEASLIFMNSFPKLIVNMKSYGNFFPAFAQLSIKDRITFFMKTRFGLLAGEGLLHSEDYYITGINSANLKKFQLRSQHNSSLSFILNRLSEQTEKSWSQLQNMKLTPLEQAFFLAFLFFDGNSI